VGDLELKILFELYEEKDILSEANDQSKRHWTPYLETEEKIHREILYLPD
jgi:hypothetical protein